ncbi:MAG: hypothetical protein E6J64_14345 [Deltaproteobacteria bacterium]|nr:MAG: hypothetical protein E6J64_14345 [Deltaproteobacteria bacterium]
MLEPVALPVVEPVALPVAEPVVELLEPVVPVAEPDALLSRSRSRGAFVSLEEVDFRIELSVALRPLARRFVFIFAPCWLQSHLHLSSLAVVSVEAATLRSEVVADDEVDSEPRSEVLLPAEVPVWGIVLSVGDAVSFFGDWVVELGRSSVVCAVTAGAASARARIEVAASFICASVWVAMLPDHGGDDLPEGQRTTPRWAKLDASDQAPKRTRAEGPMPSSLA